MKFTYGDQIKILRNSPNKYRPGEYGAICGYWCVITNEDSIEFNVPLNTLIYTVEYIDGTDCQIPEEYIEFDRNN